MAALSREQVKELIAKAPAGTTPAGIVAALRAKGHQLEGYPSAAAPAATPEPTPAGPSDPRARMGQAIVDAVPQFLEGQLQGLPTSLAMLGGGVSAALAAPTAVPTAGLGPVAAGAAGAYVGGNLGRNIVSAVETARGHGPASGLESMKAANAEGGTQAALYAGGEGLAGVAKLGAKTLMRLAARDGGPEVAKTMLANGISATTKGYKRLEARIGTAADKTMRIVRWETRRGLRYDGVRFARDLFAALGLEVDKMPIGDRTRKRLYRLTKQFLKENGGAITPERLHILKKKADEIAHPIHAALENKQSVPMSEQVWANWNKAFADRARDLLNHTVARSPNSIQPGAYEMSNNATESLIRVKRAIWPEVKKNRGLLDAAAHVAVRPAVGASIGAAAGAGYTPDRAKGAMVGAAAGALLGTPRALSMTANGLNSPLLQILLKKGPQGAAWADAISR